MSETTGWNPDPIPGGRRAAQQRLVNAHALWEKGDVESCAERLWEAGGFLRYACLGSDRPTRPVGKMHSVEVAEHLSSAIDSLHNGDYIEAEYATHIAWRSCLLYL